MMDVRRRIQEGLGDRYRIERELGRGGMGLVFLAEDLKHGRRVAIKVLRPELGQSLGGERFLREIRITARLNHPHILTLIDSGEADGLMYYVVPYVAGESLRARLKRERQLPVQEALQIACEVADALGYAHSVGVIHRDIKPENILFEEGHAMVADFGIAKAVNDAVGGGERLTESGLAVGTPAYMSPEQAAGGAEDMDARSDVYSLASVVYEMLAGAPPYVGPTAQAVLARKTLEPAPGLRVVRDTVPEHVERAVLTALARVPADRFATAPQFAAALSGTGLPPAWPAVFARSRLVALASVIVVVAAAAYVMLALRGGRSAVVASFSRVTADPGVEWFPSLSPDGRWIAYSGDGAGNRDIYLLGVGGQNAINLTKDSPADDDQPAFSPDGERIAFRSNRDGGGIFVMGRTGEAVRRITRFGYRPTWSSDGTRLAFATENVDVNPQNSVSVSQLWVVDVASGGLRELKGVDATVPSWSPHGYRIAFAMRLGQQAQGKIWTLPADGGAPVPVTTGVSRDWSPAWAPDGRYLYFASDRGGSMNLWRVRIDERSGHALAGAEAIVTPATSVAHPSLSADGRHIAYSAVVVTSNVQRVGFDPVRGVVAGGPAWVTSGSRRWANPDPSPDGRSVVLYSLTEPQGHLYVMNADGTGLRQLTGDTAVDRVPRWSPDGRWIACFSNRSGPLQIWRVRPDGSDLQQLTDAPEHVAYAVWSPDGSQMVAGGRTPRHERVYLFDPNRSWKAQRPQLLPAPDSTVEGFAPHSWSPDGARLAGMINALDEGVIVFTFGSGAYRRLTTFGQWPVWLPDGRRLLFVSGGKAFYLVDRERGQVRKVFSVGQDVIGPPQLTRDGRAMYFTRRVTAADVWVATLPP